MTKLEFFALCDESPDKSALAVSIVTPLPPKLPRPRSAIEAMIDANVKPVSPLSRLELRSGERSVAIYWPEGKTGRREKLEAASKKFTRWLDEWKAMK